MARRRGRIARKVLLLLAALAISRCGCGQGGPPLVTDDPGTPGPGNWEVNLSGALEDRRGERSFDSPRIDANYGIGRRLQAKIEVPWRIREDGASASGIGNALLGLKWRFCDEADCGASVAFYPQVEVQLSQRSVRLGLAENGTGLLLPVVAQKEFGLLSANVEGGYFKREGEGRRWIWGLALGRRWGDFEVMTEAYGSVAPKPAGSEASWDLGARWHAAPWFGILASAGTGLSASGGRAPRARALAYLGGQFLF
ncbi:MAG TPA: hypothetical protein VGH97_14405 [Thermoanaerobaculia bacterium]